MVKGQKCKNPDAARQTVVLDLRTAPDNVGGLQKLLRDGLAAVEDQLGLSGGAGGHQRDLIGPAGRELRRVAAVAEIETALLRMVGQHRRGPRGNLAKRLLIQPQIQQQRPEAGL